MRKLAVQVAALLWGVATIPPAYAGDPVHALQRTAEEMVMGPWIALGAACWILAIAFALALCAANGRDER